MVPKIMLEGGHAWVHERPIAAQLAPPLGRCCWAAAGLALLDATATAQTNGNTVGKMAVAK
jgi:hypothetical protein